VISSLFRFAALFVAAVVSAPTVFGQMQTTTQTRPQRGLVRNLPGAYQGYTVIAPLRSTSTFLVDMKGKVVHELEQRTLLLGLHLRCGATAEREHARVHRRTWTDCRGHSEG